VPRTRAYAAQTAAAPLAPFEIPRREPGPHDVELEIDWCGVCHSDLHQVRDEWGGALFPMVPGHEIVGRVVRAGAAVKKLRAGDLAGVGCMVDSCRSCESCGRDLEQFCAQGAAFTYNSTEMDRRTPTYGGYSKAIVVDERFALRIAPDQELSAVAPLLCAGITTWSPLRHWKIGKGSRVAVVGLGGLGHMAVKLAAALGAEVTLLSTSASKERDARRLGAHEFALTTADGTFRKLAGRFDLVLDTISARHDLNKHLAMLRVDGAMVLVGVPPEAAPVHAFSLIGARRSLAGSLIGGIAETQELLDFCAERKIVADVEVIAVRDVNAAYERMVRGDVRYRFVLDLATL
jgi:alcohol dehydrogenase (NADP+)